jgi:hypothetical protein
MREWISHVKAFQAQHGCSYKDALKHASPSYRAMKGGKINHLRKAGRWTNFAGNTVNSGMDLADRGMNMFGSGRLNHLKKAGRWTNFAGNTVNSGMDLADRGMNMFGSGRLNHLKKAGRWTNFAGDTVNSGMDLAGKAMSLGFGLKKHRKLKGKALMPAGAY